MRKTANAKAMAAILDSVVFVCIVSVIALLMLDSPADDAVSEQLDRSAMLHIVLIQSTIPVMDTTIEGGNCSEAQVSELLREALGSGDLGLMGRLSRLLERLSDSLVEVPYHYRWVVTGSNVEIAMGEVAVPDRCDITASKMQFECDESSFTSIFYLWIL